MPDISIQFYAAHNELKELSLEAIAEFDLHVVAMRYSPYEVQHVESNHLEDVFSASSTFNEVAFTLGEPVLPARGRMEFMDKNPDHLSLQFGKQTASSLDVASLSARTDNKDALAIWRKIASRLKKQTKPGVTAINRKSGVSAYYKSFRYTLGAYALEASGVTMMPPQGANGPKIKLGMAVATTDDTLK